MGWTVGSGSVKGWTSEKWSLNIAGRTGLACCLLGEKRKREREKGELVQFVVDWNGDGFEMQRKRLELDLLRTNIWHHKSNHFLDLSSEM